MIRRLTFAAAGAALLLPALSCVSVAASKDTTGEHRVLSPEDRDALTDARVAALKAGLKLTPVQEKNWPALEAAIRQNAKARAAHFAEWLQRHTDLEGRRDAIEALQERAKALQARSTQLTALAEAAKPLYDTLDDGQKLRFGLLLRGFGHRHGHWGHEGLWGAGQKD
jgi:zinc resistance-associated protein